MVLAEHFVKKVGLLKSKDIDSALLEAVVDCAGDPELSEAATSALKAIILGLRDIETLDLYGISATEDLETTLRKVRRLPLCCQSIE